MAALFWNQARGWGQNTTSYKFQVPVITSGLYLPSLPLLYRWKFLPIFPFFFSRSSFFLPFSSHMRGSSQFSHHCLYCWNRRAKEDVREKWNVSAIPRLRFDRPSRAQSSMAEAGRVFGCTIWAFWQSIEYQRQESPAVTGWQSGPSHSRL